MEGFVIAFLSDHEILYSVSANRKQKRPGRSTLDLAVPGAEKTTIH
jgi:hypothetical protein